MSPETGKHFIRVRVVKHLPLGLGVELENGQHGIVRIREISWKSEITSNWRNNFKIGWTGQAVSISSKKDQLREFSLRLVENDPWDDLPDDFDKDEVLEGVVTGVTVYGAFIELPGGLTGLLHHSTLPTWVKTPPLELFWPGDRVRVCIGSVSREERHIGLVLPPIAAPPQDGSTAQELNEGWSEEAAGSDDLSNLLDSDLPSQNILIVEDEPEQAEATATWLRLVRQHVHIVENAEKALDYLDKFQPDIAMVDVGLPVMDGARLARKILDSWPKIKVVSTTDWARAGDMMDMLEELQTRGVELLSKPYLFRELVETLQRIQSGERAAPAEQARDSAIESRIKLTQVPGLKINRSIQLLLQQCRRQLDYELAVLFELDPVHRTVAIYDRAGDGYLDKNAAASLIFSPVRDVAEDRASVEMEEIQPHDRDRFSYLLEMFPNFLSCIGVPVPAQLQLNYALFMLDRRAHKIPNEQKIYAEAMALAMGAALEQENFKEKSVLLQRTALIGHLTRGMVHEINNLVGPLSSKLYNLQANLKQLEQNPQQANLQEARNQLISSELVEIQKNVQKIITTSRIFGNIAARGPNRVLRVDEIVRETIHLLTDLGNRSHVTIVFSPPEQLLIIRSQVSVLEQVLLNVILNATQQIVELRPDTGGWLHVWIEPPMTKNGGKFFRILIEDIGPGIHASLWERIFEPGYTTRVDGSGIGLYISRNLLEAIGGRMIVLRSNILGGTTFALEIPSHL